MKICIVSPDLGGGGAERVALNLANYYANQGIDVSLLLFSKKGPYLKLLDSKVNVIDLKAKRIRNGLFSFIKEISILKPTHILSVSMPVNLIVGTSTLFTRKSKIIFREANTIDDINSKGFPAKKIIKSLMKWLYKKADLIISNSTDTQNGLINELRIPSEKIVVLGNPVIFSEKINNNYDHFPPPWNGDSKIILNIARLHKQKNQKMLIAAMPIVLKKISNAKLLIVGEGPEFQEIKKTISHYSMEGHVKVIPFQEDPFPIYKKSDLFVLCSDWEGFGNVQVEALAFGIPVVSTNCPGGPREILKNGEFGTLVTPGDPMELADAIIKNLSGEIIFDKNKLITRGMEFSVEVAAKNYMKYIKSC